MCEMNANSLEDVDTRYIEIIDNQPKREKAKPIQLAVAHAELFPNGTIHGLKGGSKVYVTYAKEPVVKALVRIMISHNPYETVQDISVEELAEVARLGCSQVFGVEWLKEAATKRIISALENAKRKLCEDWYVWQKQKEKSKPVRAATTLRKAPALADRRADNNDDDDEEDDDAVDDAAPPLAIPQRFSLDLLLDGGTADDLMLKALNQRLTEAFRKVPVKRSEDLMQRDMIVNQEVVQRGEAAMSMLQLLNLPKGAGYFSRSVGMGAAGAGGEDAENDGKGWNEQSLISPKWMPNDALDKCICHTVFSSVIPSNRRSHCRVCGSLRCKICTKYRVDRRYVNFTKTGGTQGASSPANDPRACKECFEKLEHVYFSDLLLESGLTVTDLHLCAGYSKGLSKAAGVASAAFRKVMYQDGSSEDVGSWRAMKVLRRSVHEYIGHPPALLLAFKSIVKGIQTVDCETCTKMGHMRPTSEINAAELKTILEALLLTADVMLKQPSAKTTMAYCGNVPSHVDPVSESSETKTITPAKCWHMLCTSMCMKTMESVDTLGSTWAVEVVRTLGQVPIFSTEAQQVLQDVDRRLKPRLCALVSLSPAVVAKALSPLLVDAIDIRGTTPTLGSFVAVDVLTALLRGAGNNYTSSLKAEIPSSVAATKKPIAEIHAPTFQLSDQVKLRLELVASADHATAAQATAMLPDISTAAPQVREAAATAPPMQVQDLVLVCEVTPDGVGLECDVDYAVDVHFYFNQWVGQSWCPLWMSVPPHASFVSLVKDLEQKGSRQRSPLIRNSMAFQTIIFPSQLLKSTAAKAVPFGETFTVRIPFVRAVVHGGPLQTLFTVCVQPLPRKVALFQTLVDLKSRGLGKDYSMLIPIPWRPFFEPMQELISVLDAGIVAGRAAAATAKSKASTGPDNEKDNIGSAVLTKLSEVHFVDLSSRGHGGFETLKKSAAWPFDPSKIIVAISKQVGVVTSATCPVRFTFTVKSMDVGVGPSWADCPVVWKQEDAALMFKQDATMRNDMVVCNTFDAIKRLWRQELEKMERVDPTDGGAGGIGRRQRSELPGYQVWPLTSQSGVMEFVLGGVTQEKIEAPDEATIKRLKPFIDSKLDLKTNSLLAHLLRSCLPSNGEEQQQLLPRIRAMSERFLESLILGGVLTFILGVKDRHEDNILITKDQHYMHIDFGHVFGDVTGTETLSLAGVIRMCTKTIGCVETLMPFDRMTTKLKSQSSMEPTHSYKDAIKKIITFAIMQLRPYYSFFVCTASHLSHRVGATPPRYDERQVRQYIDRMLKHGSMRSAAAEQIEAEVQQAFGDPIISDMNHSLAEAVRKRGGTMAIATKTMESTVEAAKWGAAGITAFAWKSTAFFTAKAEAPPPAKAEPDGSDDDDDQPRTTDA